MRGSLAAALVLGAALGCLPVATPLEGKACDEAHACGPGLSCVDGRCWAELPARSDGAGGGAGPAARPDASAPRDAGFDAGSPQDGGAPDGGGDAGAPDGGGSACGADGGAGSEETRCADGEDNDCDGLVDCQDPSCLLRACDAAAAAAVCCPDGTGQGACKDLSTDPRSCGACGVSCASGRSCTPVSVAGLLSGRCGCGGDSDCPQPGSAGLSEDQDCEQNHCTCDSAGECATGQRCTRVEGLSNPGFCHY